MHEKCLRCGRPLSNPESQKIGYGPTCNKRRLRIAAQQPHEDSLFDVIKDLQAQISEQNKLITSLQSEVAELKAGGVVSVPATIPMPTNMPPAPPMVEEPSVVNEIVIANNGPDVASAFYEVQADLERNLTKLRKIADETSTISLGTAAAECEDTSGMDALKIMQAKIRGE